MCVAVLFVARFIVGLGRGIGCPLLEGGRRIAPCLVIWLLGWILGLSRSIGLCLGLEGLLLGLVALGRPEASCRLRPGLGIGAGGNRVGIHHHAAGSQDIKAHLQRKPGHGAAQGKAGAVEHIHIAADFRFVHQLVHHHQGALSLAQAGHGLAAAIDVGDIYHISVNLPRFLGILRGSARERHHVAFRRLLHGLLVLGHPAVAGAAVLRLWLCKLLKLGLLGRGEAAGLLLRCRLMIGGLGRCLLVNRWRRVGILLRWLIGRLLWRLGIRLLINRLLWRLGIGWLLVGRLLLIGWRIGPLLGVGINTLLGGWHEWYGFDVDRQAIAGYEKLFTKGYATRQRYDAWHYIA